MSTSESPRRWFRPHTLWLPTWRTTLLASVTVLPCLLWVLAQLYPWLSVTAPIEDAKYAVVEGWASDFVVAEAVAWTKKHEVKMIFTTGIPGDMGMYLVKYPTYAEMCADTLRHMGADPAKVTPAPGQNVDRERTRAMAMGLKHALDASQIPAGERKINLFTAGAHAYRSRMHFRRVLGPEWQVGVISVAPVDYFPGGWWNYSEGVKSVIEEIVGIIGQSIGPRP